MKHVIYLLILFIPSLTVTHDNDKYRFYDQSVYALRASNFAKASMDKTTRHRNNFITFIRSNHQLLSKGYVIKQLLRCLTQELKQFFQLKNYSQKEILHIKELYLSQEFIKLAKTFDGYEDAIKQLRKKHLIKQKILNWIPFYEPKEKCYHKRIKQLGKEIDEKKELKKLC